jgi:hypothetical protein
MIITSVILANIQNSCRLNQNIARMRKSRSLLLNGFTDCLLGGFGTWAPLEFINEMHRDPAEWPAAPRTG